jgi:hypothetical protein
VRVDGEEPGRRHGTRAEVRPAWTISAKQMQALAGPPRRTERWR